MSSSPPSRLGRVLRVAGVAIGVLLAGWLGWLLIQPPVLQAQARNDLAAGLAAERAPFEAAVQEDLRALAPALGEPAGRRSGYVCQVAHDDQGWTVARWRHECSLRSVAVYPTTRSPVAAEAAIAALPGAEQRFGKPWTTIEPQRCRYLFPSPTRPSARVRHWDAGCRGTIPGRDSDRGWVTFTTLPDGVPGGDGSWIVVERSRRVSNTVLGCRPLPMFCLDPLTEPVVG
ncbi:MAG: hypothetical protein KBG85_04055 [Micropruina sp.]|nr:hypothetical protein [Micropruina sp.]